VREAVAQSLALEQVSGTYHRAASRLGYRQDVFKTFSCRIGRCALYT
jgi:hypothetical protein